MACLIVFPRSPHPEQDTFSVIAARSVGRICCGGDDFWGICLKKVRANRPTIPDPWTGKAAAVLCTEKGVLSPATYDVRTYTFRGDTFED